MASTPTTPSYPSGLRWLADPLPKLDYQAMGSNLTRDERELLERYLKNVERLAGMQAPRGWNAALGIFMVGRQVVRSPDGRGHTRGEPFEFDPAFAEFLDAFIFRLRKLYLSSDAVTFHAARTALGHSAPRGHPDTNAFLGLLRELKQQVADALDGKGAPVCLHGPGGAQIKAEQFFEAWLHDEWLHENLNSSPKRSWVWQAFPDQLTRAVFINTAFALFEVYGRLGLVVAKVLDKTFAAPDSAPVSVWHAWPP